MAKEFPKKVTQESLPQLVQKGKKLKRNGNIASFLTFFVYGIVALLASPFLLFLSGQIVVNSSPLMSTEEFTIAIIVTFFVVYAAFLLYFFMFLEYVFKKAFKLEYDELVFYESILIADNLMKNNKHGAIKEVDGFLSWLHVFQRTSRYNSKAKRYAPEIKTLNSGRKEMKRLLLFSTKDLSEFFINFGTSLVNNDDPTAIRYLQYIISEAKQYGKFEGWLHRAETQARNFRTILYSISIIIGIVVSIVTVMGLLGLL